MKVDALSKAELQVMAALWRLGAGSVADIQRELGKERKLAYTTVATYLTRMAEKGAVTSRKVGRAYVFEPSESLSDYQKATFRDLVARFFDGRPTALVSHFIETTTFTDDELATLRALLEDKAGK